MANNKKKPTKAKVEVISEAMDKVEEVKEQVKSDFEKAYDGLTVVRH